MKEVGHILYRRRPQSSLRLNASPYVTQRARSFPSVLSPEFTTWNSHCGADFYGGWVKTKATIMAEWVTQGKHEAGGLEEFCEGLACCRGLFFKS